MTKKTALILALALAGTILGLAIAFLLFGAQAAWFAAKYCAIRLLFYICLIFAIKSATVDRYTK